MKPPDEDPRRAPRAAATVRPSDEDPGQAAHAAATVKPPDEDSRRAPRAAASSPLPEPAGEADLGVDWSSLDPDADTVERLVRRALAQPAPAAPVLAPAPRSPGARRQGRHPSRSRWGLAGLLLAAMLVLALLLRSPAEPVHAPAAFSIHNEGDLIVVHTPAGETWVQHPAPPAPQSGTILIHMGEVK